MNTSALKDLLCDEPDSTLLEAVNGNRDHRALLPLLDAEIQRSSSRLQRLREYRNSLASPIHNLLPEILSHIFFIYAQDNDELFNMRWARLLLVCRRWRDIGMLTPKLWSFMDLFAAYYDEWDEASARKEARDAQRVRAQMARVGLAPTTVKLTLHLNLSEPKRACLPMFWIPSALQSFHLNGINAPFHEVIDVFVKHQHSSLAHFAAYQLVPAGPFDDAARAVTPLPDDILKVNLPRLRELSLAGFRFNWTFIHDLRVLNVEYYPENDLSSTLRDISDALTRCSALEELWLILHSEGDGSMISSFSQTVWLPNAQIISLQGPAGFCLGLLEALTDLPCTSQLRVSPLHPPSLTSNDVCNSPLLSYLTSHARRVDAPTMRAVSLVNQPLAGMYQTGVSGYAQVDRCLDPEYMSNHHGQPSSHIHFSTRRHIQDAPLPTPEVEHIMRHIIRTWNFTNVTHFDLRLAGWDPDIPWQHLLAELPSVTTIIMRPEQPTSPRLVLGFLHEQLQTHGRRVVPNIVFDAQKVNPYVSHAELSLETLARRTLMHTLMYCAAAARAGVPLETVEIINDLEPSRFKARVLEPTIASFVWSGLYQDLSTGFIYCGVLHNQALDCSAVAAVTPQGSHSELE
ncbi:unnamed protein product [Peniophora sp. CBMAI 1063]|nr:unnamed protein product [Peniophora sp. CBMAI 1063]